MTFDWLFESIKSKGFPPALEISVSYEGEKYFDEFEHPSFYMLACQCGNWRIFFLLLCHILELEDFALEY